MEKSWDFTLAVWLHDLNYTCPVLYCLRQALSISLTGMGLTMWTNLASN